MLSGRKTGNRLKRDTDGSSTYSTRFFTSPVPKYKIPEEGFPANAAYQLIHDEMNFDGNPALNLASFVTTWMEPEAEKLVNENINKNFIDHSEYPQTEILHHRVVTMLADLFHAPEDADPVGTAAIGSSEAILLGLLAHKWTWRKRRQAEGKPTDKPNLVFGADVHIVWDKFARYFDVEARIVPMETDRFLMDVAETEKLIDENTIAVGAVLGTTFTGQIDPIREINDLLERLLEENGWDIPLHVDGASGGFTVPFVDPEFHWDFRLSRVKSINASGHKYGLVYPGIGWLIFRDRADLPEDLIFHCNYLGESMPTFTLNFSRGSSMVIGQYYNFIRLGMKGYTDIMTNSLNNSLYLYDRLAATGRFDFFCPKSEMKLPVVAFRLKDGTEYTGFELVDKLRERGWIIPAYTLPPNADSIVAMRVVVRENFSRDMAEILAEDIVTACARLDKEKKIAQLDHEHHPAHRTRKMHKHRKGHHIC